MSVDVDTLIEFLLESSPPFKGTYHQVTGNEKIDSISESTLSKLTNIIPLELSLPLLNKSIDYYWTCYDKQFPIVHKPSFTPNLAHPLLVLAMVMMGLSLAEKLEHLSTTIHEEIADQLRWKLCEEAELANDYIPLIQCLLILESYEINGPSRILHRRAKLHRGLKLELMKNCNNLTNWVDTESLKRCTYAAFTIDTFQSLIFGHDPIAFTHNISFAVPCAPQTWKSTHGNKLKSNTYADSITDALKEVENQAEGCKSEIQIRQLRVSERGNSSSPSSAARSASTSAIQKFNTNGLSSHIVLAGLVNIQLYARISGISVEPIFSSLDFWYDHCDPGESLNEFHIAQMFLRISSFECLLYAGAPRRSISNTEVYHQTQQRVREWAESTDGRILVVHAYMLILDVMIPDGIPSAYEPDSDTIFYRPNMIALALFVIWVFNFYHNGADNIEVNGYSYVQNIKSIFGNEGGGSGVFAKYAKKVAPMKGVAGLLKVFERKYATSGSQVYREYGRLMGHCIRRSMGGKEVICWDMYDD